MLQNIYKLFLIKLYGYLPNYPKSYVIYKVFERVRQFVYKKLFRSFGSNSYCRSNCYISGWKNIGIGNNCIIGPNAILNSLNAKICIGDNFLSGPELIIYTSEHGMELKENMPFYKQDISSEDVVIGNNVIISACSIVTSNIPTKKVKFLGA